MTADQEHLERFDADDYRRVGSQVAQHAADPSAPIPDESPRQSANAGSRGVIRNALLSYASMGVNMATGLFTTPLLLSRLGANHFGVWALMGSVATYTGLIEIGLGTALAKHVAEYEAQDDKAALSRVLGTALTMYLVVAAGVLLMTTGMALLVDRIFQIPPEQAAEARLCLLVLGGNQAMIFLFTVQNALLYGAGRLDLLTMAGIVINLAATIANVVVVLLGFGVVTLSCVVCGSTLLMGLATRRIIKARFSGVRFSPREFSLDSAKKLLQLGMRNAVIYLFAAVGVGSDAVVIGIFLPASAVANYAVAAKLTTLVRTLATKPIDVTMPSVAHASALNEHERLFGIQTQATLLSLSVALPMVIGLSVFADRVITFWVGAGHLQAAPVLLVLALTIACLLPGNVSLALTTGTGRNAFFMKVALVSAPLNLLLSVLFTFWLRSPVGVALGSLLTAFVADLMVIPYLTCRQYGFRIRRYLIEGFGPLLMPVIATAALALALRWATPNVPGVWLMPTLGAVAVTFAAALLLSVGPTRRREYVDKLRAALSRRGPGRPADGAAMLASSAAAQS